MPRLAVVEYTMSAGGLERVLRGLARAFLEIPEARDWDVTFLLGRYNSAQKRVDWPADLTGPRVRVQWLGEGTGISRALDPIAHGQGILGLPLSRAGGMLGARTLRRLGPPGLRAVLGDPEAVIDRAAARFDALLFPYPVLLDPPGGRTPVVCTPQDFNYKHFLAEGDPTRRRHERATRAWLARSARVLLTTEAVRDELLRFYPEGAGKAAVVPLGVEPAGAPPSSEELADVRARLGLPASFVLCAGWVLPHKNQLVLVEALARLRRQGRHVPVLFVGPNAASLVRAREPGFREEYPARVREALDAAGLEAGRDWFAPGYVSDADVRRLFRMAAAFVLPSLYEGFGLPSLEALVAGCPTVVSAIPPLLEQNRRLGGEVATFRPDDAEALATNLEGILARPEAAREAARSTGERVTRVYDWRATARAYLDACSGAISASG